MRSRIPREHDNRDFSDYSDQMLVASATGIRRQSMLVIRPVDCVRDSDGVVIGIHVVEKGGRHRIAPVLTACRVDVTRIVDQAMMEHGQDAPIFERYDVHIDNHHIRAEYAERCSINWSKERAEDSPHLVGRSP